MWFNILIDFSVASNTVGSYSMRSSKKQLSSVVNFSPIALQASRINPKEFMLINSSIE